MADRWTKDRVTLLKERTKRCTCRYCGGDLEVSQIMFFDNRDSRIELFCKDCDRIEFGVEKQIYSIACYFVEEAQFNHYQDLDDNEKAKQMNIAKICDIIAWGCKKLGFLNEDGFDIEVEGHQDLQGKMITLDEEKLLKLLEEVNL